MRKLRVLEVGNYLAIAYAGMVLAEQGHEVIKWYSPKDPLLDLNQGEELWSWLNAGKELIECHASQVNHWVQGSRPFDVVIDNFRPQAWEKWGVNLQHVANQHGIVWVSLRADVGDRSVDMVAQARSWLEYSPWIPFYLGDTCAGLWLAFKAAACDRPGHYSIGQASCLQKLVEGELMIDVPRHPRWQPENHLKQHPLDPDTYYFDGDRGETAIDYRGHMMREPVRDRGWKLKHLWHQDGRIVI